MTAGSQVVEALQIVRIASVSGCAGARTTEDVSVRSRAETRDWRYALLVLTSSLPGDLSDEMLAEEIVELVPLDIESLEFVA